MKKKIVNCILLILLLVIVIAVAFLNHRPKEKESEKEIIEVAKTEYIEIEKLPEKYSTEQAIQDNCVVVVHSSKVYNLEVLENFVKLFNEKKSGQIRIMDFTVEGDSIIKDICLDENGTITYVVDNRRDKYASSEDRKIIRSSYSIDEYQLIEDEYKENKSVYLEKRNGELESRVYITSYPFESRGRARLNKLQKKLQLI